MHAIQLVNQPKASHQPTQAQAMRFFCERHQQQGKRRTHHLAASTSPGGVRPHPPDTAKAAAPCKQRTVQRFGSAHSHIQFWAIMTTNHAI